MNNNPYEKDYGFQQKLEALEREFKEDVIRHFWEYSGDLPFTKMNTAIYLLANNMVVAQEEVNEAFMEFVTTGIAYAKLKFTDSKLKESQ